MKKDKETRPLSPWQQWQKSPTFFKNFFVYFALSILFILSVSISIYRYINKPPQTAFVLPSAAPEATPKTAPDISALKSEAAPEAAPDISALKSEVAPEAAPDISALKSEVALLTSRLTSLTNDLDLPRLGLQISHRLIAFEMLKESLEGHLPLKTVILYLQKTSEPWTTDILKTLSPLKESKTYAQLQALLVLPPTPHPLSRWQRVKNIITSFVRIRKLDKDGHYKLSNLDDIQTALQERNIQQAVKAFDKLPPQAQAQLASWKQEARTRLTLETIKQKILLELSGS